MKNRPHDIRPAVAAGCSSAEEYDLKTALLGMTSSFKYFDRFWLYFRLAQVKKLLDRLNVTYDRVFYSFYVLFFVSGFILDPDWSALIPLLALAAVFFAVSFLYLMYFITDCQISDAKFLEGVSS